MSAPKYACATCDEVERGAPAGACSTCRGDLCPRCLKTHVKGHYQGHEFTAAPAASPPLEGSVLSGLESDIAAPPAIHPGIDILAKFSATPAPSICADHGSPYDLRCLSCSGLPLLCASCFSRHLGHEMSTLKELAAKQCEQLQRALQGGGQAPSGQTAALKDAPADGTPEAAEAGGAAAAAAPSAEGAPPPGTLSVADSAKRLAKRAVADIDSLKQRTSASADAINAAFDALVAAANARRQVLLDTLSAASTSIRAPLSAEAKAASQAVKDARKLADDVRSAATLLPDIDVVVHGSRMMMRIGDFAARVQRDTERLAAAAAEAPTIEVVSNPAALIKAIDIMGSVTVKHPPRRRVLATYASASFVDLQRQLSDGGAPPSPVPAAAEGLDVSTARSRAPDSARALTGRPSQESFSSNASVVSGAGGGVGAGLSPPQFVSPLRAVVSLPDRSLHSILSTLREAAAMGRVGPTGPQRLTGAVVDGHYASPCVTKTGSIYLPKDGEAGVLVMPGDDSAHNTLPLAPLGLSRSTVSAGFDDASGSLVLADSTRLVALDPTNSSIRWSTPPGAFDDCYGIAVLPHVVVAASRHDSLLHAYRLADGTRLSTVEAKCPIYVATDVTSQSVFVSVGFGSCVVQAFHWDGVGLRARGTVKAAGTADAWRPLAVVPPRPGSYTSHLVVGTNGSPHLRVLKLPELELVHEVRLDGMKVTGLAAHPSGEALFVCDRVSWAIYVLPWPLEGMLRSGK